jgi:hypothetical protein
MAVGRDTSAGRTPGSAANSGVSKPKTAFYGAAIFRTLRLCVFCGVTLVPATLPESDSQPVQEKGRVDPAGKPLLNLVQQMQPPQDLFPVLPGW